MCMSSPKMPTPTPPPVPPDPQEAKAPDLKAVRKSSSNTPIAGGTLLTGPSGVQNNQLPLAGSSLLGG